MTRTIPGHVHAFELTRVTSSAVTFHLRPSPRARDGHSYHVSGWALATVNDDTGELAIQSDWGNWSYRWNVHHLGRVGSDGRPATLTEFIADRDSGHCDYLAGKLSSRGETDVFDADATVREMRRRLIERRIDAARAAIETYRGDPDDERPDVLVNPPRWLASARVYSYGREEQWQFSRENVRAVYDALGELDTIDGHDLFCERFFAIVGYVMVTDAPWEGCLQHRPSSSYEQLLYGILPALVEACRRRVAEAANDLDPATTPGDHSDRVVVPTSR